MITAKLSPEGELTITYKSKDNFTLNHHNDYITLMGFGTDFRAVVIAHHKQSEVKTITFKQNDNG